MRLAMAEAGIARESGEVPVGAVIVRGGEVVATGRNRSIADKDPTAHAEVVALRAAAMALGNYRLDGCTLYVTLEPCPMCCGAMFHARLGRVVFGAPDPRTGSAGSVIDLFAQERLNHHADVEGGVLAAECAMLLHDFFRDKRRSAKNRHPLREDALRTPESAFAAVAVPDDARGSAATCWFDHEALQGLRMHCMDFRPDAAAAGKEHPSSDAWLLLHGPEAWGQRFRAAADALARSGRRVVVPDLIGFGRSDKPKREAFHDPDWHARSVLALMDELGLDRVVVAVEEGGLAVASALLQLARQRCAGLVVLDSIPGALPRPEWHADAPYPDRGHRAGPRALRKAAGAFAPAAREASAMPASGIPVLRVAADPAGADGSDPWLARAMEYFAP